MKRITAAVLCLLSLLWAIDATARFPRGSPDVVNMGGGPNMLERSLFSNNTPYLPYSQWYVPGNGSPAISTSDYYNINGWYWSIPFDLDTAGADGAAIKTREGGLRYAWIIAGDHVGVGVDNFDSGSDIYVGYSNDPQTLPDPSTIRVLMYQQTAINATASDGTTQNNWFVYQGCTLVYNPDTNVVTTDKWWVYCESVSTSTGLNFELGLFTSPDLLISTPRGPTIPTSSIGAFTAYGRPKRLGVNSWEYYGFGKADNSAVSGVYYKYTSTDGWQWTPDYTTIRAYGGLYFTMAGQDYALQAVHPGVGYVTLQPINGTTKVPTGGLNVNISAAFGDDTQIYPGPTYLQDTQFYAEDGIASIYVARGFPPSSHNLTNIGPYLGNVPNTYTINVSGISGDTMTVSSVPGGMPPLAAPFKLAFQGNIRILNQINGTPGGAGQYQLSSTSLSGTGATTFTIITNGGLWHQFIDQYFLILDSTTAANAAPLGVKASCSAGVATVQWNNSLPHQNYRIYKGTSAGTQATLVGNVTGTSISDTPTANSQTWYKVVTMNVTEQKSRVVNVYCSSQNAQVNKHINRVINDGGAGYDVAFIANADTWLTSNNAYRYLNWWTDVRFGYKLDGSGFISKIYDLGTTLLPKGGDYTPTTSNTFPSTSSNTSYSVNSFRGTTPSWINNAASAHGYFGNGRFNNIQRWNEITLLAAYQQPCTAGCTLFGTGQFASGMFLTQDSGSSGNINFSMYASNNPPSSGPITSTVAFSGGNTARVIAGVFDGTNMTTYLNGTPGTPVSATSYTNPLLLNETVLRGGRNNNSGGGVVLSSGGRGLVTSAPTYIIENNALFTGAGLAVFNKGFSQSLIQSWGTTFYN